MSLIDGTEPGKGGVAELAQRALHLRAGAAPARRDGLRLAAMFLNPSLRTRASLEAAAGALGIQPIILQPGKDSWALEFADGAVMNGTKAEHVRDAVAVLEQYADMLAVRAFAGLESLQEDRADRVIGAFARYSGKPVINLESALWHPLQGLADTATWMSHLGPDLQGKRVTLTWAPHPKALPAAVPNQVALSAALQGMHVTIAHPRGFDLDPQVIERVDGLARASGGGLDITHDPDEAMHGAQVVVAKSWSGFSGYGRREAEATERDKLGHWQVTPDRMAMSEGAGFMHCLPVRRNVVVADAVLDGPASWVHETAGLRMWTAMALLERLGEAW